jgi:hypothetical protein
MMEGVRLAMSELSSCYFCGTALDAPVRRYPVTPSDIDVDTGRTVALCPPCRRKLGKVLSLVADEMDAVAADSRAETDEGAVATEMEEEEPADDDVESGDEGDEVTEEATGEAGAGTVDEESGEAAVEAVGEDGDEATDEMGEASEGIIDESPAGTVEGADHGDVESGSESVGASSDESVEWGMPDDESDEGTELDAEDTAGETDAAEADAAETAGGDPGGGTPEVLSTPSAKKVIRLLQNREFPVEREEFEVIAQNAYDIPLRDCQEVVDTLVEEDYVGQEGGQLVREE